MKHLSIEEKVKAYDEAFNRASGFKTVECKDIAEYIFPELRESEDERIRKEIISALKWANHRGVYDKHIAWLEKQGNSDINPSEFDLRLNKLLKQFETLPKEELASSLSFYLNVVQNDGTYRQKLSDKVEPKFKVGDWVMLDRPVLIIKAEYMSYNTNQYWTSDGTWFGDGTKAKLWNIKDAKDGDVLVTIKGGVFIYAKNLYNEPYGYCGVDKYGVFKDNCSNNKWTDSVVNIYPATKEQRDTLFAKMKEAGYEWDAEKKELKKIDQKPIIEPKFKVGDLITNNACTLKISSIKDGYYWTDNDCVGGDIESIDKEYHIVR